MIVFIRGILQLSWIQKNHTLTLSFRRKLYFYIKHIIWVSILSSVYSVAAADSQNKLRCASVVPAQTPWGEYLKHYLQTIEEESQNKLGTELYLSGSIGGEPDIIQALRRGRIQCALISSGGLMGTIPEIGVIELPFLWQDTNEIDFVFDRVLSGALEPHFLDRGLKLVHFADAGWFHLAAKQVSIRSPSQLHKFEAGALATKMSLAFWHSFDANPIALSYADLLPSLQTGLVHGIDSEIFSIYYSGFYRTAPHITLTHHSYQVFALVLNSQWLDSLDEELARTISTVPKRQTQALKTAVRDLQKQVVLSLREDGAQVYELSKSEKVNWRRIIRSQIPLFLNTLGGGAHEIYQLIENAKVEYSKKKSGNK